MYRVYGLWGHIGDIFSHFFLFNWEIHKKDFKSADNAECFWSGLFQIFNLTHAFDLWIEIYLLRVGVDSNLILDPYSVISSRLCIFYCFTNFIMTKEQMNNQLKRN